MGYLTQWVRIMGQSSVFIYGLAIVHLDLQSLRGPHGLALPQLPLLWPAA